MDDDIQLLLREERFREAFVLIVERYREKVFRLAISYLKETAAAEDMAQDVLVRIWKGLPGYNASASVSTWVYTITRNTCLSELKRRSRRPTVSLEGMAEHAEESGSTFELAAPQEETSGASLDVPALLELLPEKYRQVIHLFYMEQKRYEEVAELLGIPLGTVKTLIFRARRELMRLVSRRSLAPLVS
jgi:RNA polymerase sigma-70 factor (ECF subfamily)